MATNREARRAAIRASFAGTEIRRMQVPASEVQIGDWVDSIAATTNSKGVRFGDDGSRVEIAEPVTGADGWAAGSRWYGRAYPGSVAIGVEGRNPLAIEGHAMVSIRRRVATA